MDSLVEISIVANDERIFTTKLQRNPGKPATADFSNPAPHSRRTGKADYSDIWIFYNRCASILSKPLNYVKDTVR